MNKCTFFIKNKALFGGFPTQEEVLELENQGVRFFVNLTFDYEKKIVPYNTNYTKIQYSIKDRFIPTNWYTFTQFIVKIAKIIDLLKNNEMVYIHCKQGSGRSGIVVAVLLCYLYNIDSKTSLEVTRRCHSFRTDLKEKWKIIGSPQTKLQKIFVHKFFSPLIFNKLYRFGISTLPNTTEQNIYNYLKHKFDSYPQLRINLLNTCLRPLVYISDYDVNDNTITKILTKIRNDYFTIT